MREHEGLLTRLEGTLSRMSGWLLARRRAEPVASHARHERVEAFRLELAHLRRGVGETTRADVARVRAALDDLRRDYDVPPQRTGLTHAELEAFRRHLQVTSRLLRDLSNLDSPEWERAHEEYERSWAEVERAFEAQGESPSP
ncbi:MAG TPA: hypothetical protein VD838_18685 [Anaeromyxobacteraceae bacterium]|nr:hypothetical protein [Anaeromyxobacteraceae bacterium]